MWVEPIQNNSKDLDSVAVQLLDKLKLCQSNAGTLPKEHSRQLQECFTNLLTYVNQIVQLSKDKHFSKCFESVATQSDVLEQFDVGIQTENKTEPKEDKYIQTFNSQYRNVLVQTDDLEEIISSLKGAKEGKTASQSKREEPVVSLDKTSKKVADPGKFSSLLVQEFFFLFPLNFEFFIVVNKFFFYLIYTFRWE